MALLPFSSSYSILNIFPKFCPRLCDVAPCQEGICKATRKRKTKLQWFEAGPRNHHDHKVNSDQ